MCSIGRSACRRSSSSDGCATVLPQLARTHAPMQRTLELQGRPRHWLTAWLAARRNQLRAAVIAAPAVHALRIRARQGLLPGPVQIQRFSTQAHDTARVRHHPGVVTERRGPEIFHPIPSPGPHRTDVRGWGNNSRKVSICKFYGISDYIEIDAGQILGLDTHTWCSRATRLRRPAKRLLRRQYLRFRRIHVSVRKAGNQGLTIKG